MRLSDRILEYALKRGHFNMHEITQHCLEAAAKNDVPSNAAIARCLRRLKSSGYLWNKRDLWYFRKEKNATVMKPINSGAKNM